MDRARDGDSTMAAEASRVAKRRAGRANYKRDIVRHCHLFATVAAAARI